MSYRVIDRREQRVVVEMLMIDHVVLHLVDHLAEVVDLEDEDPVVLEGGAHGSGDALNVGDVCVDVVRHHQIGFSVALDNVFDYLLGEEIVDDCHPRIIDGLYDVGGGIDAYHGADTLVGQWPEQDTVVAAELDYSRPLGLDEPRRNFGGVGSEVIAKRLDGGREIEVVVEQHVGADLVDHLDGEAVLAEIEAQRVRGFGSP